MIIKDNHCMYVKRYNKGFFIVSLYINDILIARNDKEMIVIKKLLLFSNFEMKDVDKANYVIDTKIIRDQPERFLGLSQKTYMKKILE